MATAFQPSSAFDLSGRVVLITGGSRGLGAAMAWGFARAGADLIIASRNKDSCVAIGEQITAETGRAVLPYGVHVGRWAELDGLVDAAYERFGRVDVLVNNAGMSPLYDSLTSVTEELFDKVIAVNLKGPFRLSALVGERMVAAGRGSIINISSAGAVRPRPHFIPYAAAKAGLNAMTQGLAHALGPTVRCNAVMAGTFATDVSRAWDPEQVARRAATYASRRVGEPHEIVGIVLYLSSDAASYTTGSVIAVDGGQP
jgi:Dehydrogenases with different specificities (related to short-chain alcohol dehydrogenases)